MKKTLTTLALALVTTVTFAQVGIGTKTPAPTAVLDLNATDKGFLPPRLTTVQRDAIASPPAGLVVYNTTTKRLEYSNGTDWINLVSGSVINAVNATTNSGSGVAAIGTKTPNPAAVLDLTATDKGFLPPRLTTAQREAIASPAEGLTIYNTDNNCLEFRNATDWISACDGSVVTPPPPLPSNIDIKAGQVFYIASMYDDDYHPYTLPTAPANASAFAAGGGTDPLVDTQGTLTTTGATLLIPYTVTTAPVNLPAFSQTRNVPANLTEDGIARDVTLSYTAQTLAVGSGFIQATIQAVGGDLNAIKLDLRNGLGDGSEQIFINSAAGSTTRSVRGLLLANFTLATDDAGNTGEVQLRDVPCFNDINVGEGNIVHMMYDYDGNGTLEYSWCAREVSAVGFTWLDRNLGAYRLPNAIEDKEGYGDSFQWGRLMDGHQKVGQRSGDLFENGFSQGTANGITTIQSATDVPGNNLWIQSGPSFGTTPDWRDPKNDNLWQGVNGINNPCPIGYRVPTKAEFDALDTSISPQSDIGAFNSPLKFTRFTWYRITADSGIPRAGSLPGINHAIWSSDTLSNGWSWLLLFENDGGNPLTSSTVRGWSFPVRCIKD